jgi:hypothetical protein
MKSKSLSHIIVCAAAVTIVSFTSCSRSHKRESELSNEIATIAEASSAIDTGAARGPDGKPDIRKVDMQAYYQSVLKKYGVDDFSTGSLIGLMDSEIPSVRAFSALLLARLLPFLRWSMDRKSVVQKIDSCRFLLIDNVGKSERSPLCSLFHRQQSQFS